MNSNLHASLHCSTHKKLQTVTAGLPMVHGVQPQKSRENIAHRIHLERIFSNELVLNNNDNSGMHQNYSK